MSRRNELGRIYAVLNSLSTPSDAEYDAAVSGLEAEIAAAERRAEQRGMSLPQRLELAAREVMRKGREHG